MDTSIALFLLHDGIFYGAIYALLALGLVFTFSVTRIIFIPIGEFVSWGALTLATVRDGVTPPLIWLLICGCCFVVLKRVVLAFYFKESVHWKKTFLGYILYPILLSLLLFFSPLANLPLVLQILIVLLLLVAIGGLLWDIAYAPVADASPLLLLIISIAAHLVMVGIGLMAFGPNGKTSPAFFEGSFALGTLMDINYQSVAVIVTTLVLMLAFFIFFRKTMLGKALRATAMNRAGAQLMGIPTQKVGSLTMMVSAGLGSFVGILIGSAVTLSYDSGFIIGLKGFIGAIVGGLASYPISAMGAVVVSLLEVFSSFTFDSNYKDVIVFTLIVPVLLWRSMRATHIEEE